MWFPLAFLAFWNSSVNGADLRSVTPHIVQDGDRITLWGRNWDHIITTDEEDQWMLGS